MDMISRWTDLVKQELERLNLLPQRPGTDFWRRDECATEGLVTH